jgi:flagellar basal-body rod protein FlgC
MNSIITTALSGLDAARKRLEVSASNVANADSEGALPDTNDAWVSDSGAAGAPQPYAPLGVSQRPLSAGGTVATIDPVDPAVVRRYAPDASYASREGLVASPNVDLVSEGINQIAAARAYEANAQVMRVALDLERETLDAFGRPPRLDLNA